MTDFVISTENLTKDFGGFRAVDNLSINIERGRITALLGPNGAGKTTTIQMLLNLITPKLSLLSDTRLERE